MSRLLVLLIMLFSCSSIYGQGHKQFQSKLKHTDKIISVATSDLLFATSSYDKSVIVWDYNGKVVYRYTLANGKINALSFIPNSNSLLIGVTEMNDDETPRPLIRCLNDLGKTEFELIDKRLDQENVNILFEKNVTGVRNAIEAVESRLPQLDIEKDVEVPRVSNGISHVELVQSIAVSPDNKIIASIDKFNILKIWDQNHEVTNSYKILNNKKDTNIYFQSDSIIFIEPNIIFNTRDANVQIIKGFENYSGVPLKSVVYFHFNYNNNSRPEKLYDLKTSSSTEFDSNNFYTVTGSHSNDKIALLGVDGLIRVIKSEGKLLSTFGKDRSELITFRGDKIQLFSKINSIGFSPNGQNLISGDDTGKVIIWKQE